MSHAMKALAVAAALGGLLAGCQDTSGLMEQAASENSPFIGREAPDFSLLDQDGKPASLGELRGQWVVLYFYPKDDTPGCACEARDFTTLLRQFRGLNAVVLGVSPDSQASHRKFIAKHHLKVRLLSDEDRRIMPRYGAWMESELGDRKFGRVVRSTFIIDPQGVIRHHWPEVIPRGHARRVADKLAELQQTG